MNCVLFNIFKIYCNYNIQNKIRYNKFLLKATRKWLIVNSNECTKSGISSGIYKSFLHWFIF